MGDEGDRQAQHVVAARFRRIPLGLRVAVYGTGFLALVLGILPYLFHQLDVRLPALHEDIGAFRVLGMVLAVVALALYVRAARVLISRGKGGHVELDPPTEFVVTGPYQNARNPVAGYLLLTMLGEAIAFSSTGIFIMFCLAAALAHMQVTRIEEPLLRKRYGRAYEEYCARVPRWIPRRRRTDGGPRTTS